MFVKDTSKVEVRQVRKGYSGVFAKVDIESGAYVFVEDIIAFENVTAVNQSIGEPVLLTARLLSSPDVYQKVLDAGAQKNLWKQPTDKHDKRMLKVLQQRSGESKKTIEEIYNVVCAYNTRTCLVLGNGIQHRVQLSALTNMINHSCSPNVVPIFQFSDLSEFRQRIAAMTALQDIRADEEITFSYLRDKRVPHINPKSRKKILNEEFGFNCKCALCVASSGNSGV